jgi:hypothetical protein
VPVTVTTQATAIPTTIKTPKYGTCQTGGSAVPTARIL